MTLMQKIISVLDTMHLLKEIIKYTDFQYEIKRKRHPRKERHLSVYVGVLTEHSTSVSLYRILVMFEVTVFKDLLRNLLTEVTWYFLGSWHR